MGINNTLEYNYNYLVWVSSTEKKIKIREGKCAHRQCVLDSQNFH